MKTIDQLLEKASKEQYEGAIGGSLAERLGKDYVLFLGSDKTGQIGYKLGENANPLRNYFWRNSGTGQWHIDYVRFLEIIGNELSHLSLLEIPPQPHEKAMTTRRVINALIRLRQYIEENLDMYKAKEVDTNATTVGISNSGIREDLNELRRLVFLMSASPRAPPIGTEGFKNLAIELKTFYHEKILPRYLPNGAELLRYKTEKVS